MPGYVYDGTTWKTMAVPGFQVHTGTAWKDVDFGYVYTGTEWKEFYRKVPDMPLNFRATNLGVHATSIDLAWDAVPGATGYQLYWGGGNLSVLNPIEQLWTETGVTFGNLDANTKHSFWVQAMYGTTGSPIAGPVKIVTGWQKASIPAGTGYVSGNVQSHNRFRAGTWGYGGVGDPYWGWYDTQAYRYHGFLEIPDWLLRDAIAAKYPSLSGRHGSVTCTSAGIFLARKSGVGDWGSDITVQVSLGDGISYASPAEPPAQANYHDFTLKKVQTNNAKVGYVMPGNWFTAIYQNHSHYNGLLFRPYRNVTGARQPYAAILQNAVWDMHLKWDEIVTQEFKGTYAW